MADELKKWAREFRHAPECPFHESGFAQAHVPVKLVGNPLSQKSRRVNQSYTLKKGPRAKGC